jgi:hypothetical protein
MLDSIARRANPPEPEYPGIVELTNARKKTLDALAQKIGKQVPKWWTFRDIIEIAKEETILLVAKWKREHEAEMLEKWEPENRYKKMPLGKRRRVTFCLILSSFLLAFFDAELMLIPWLLLTSYWLFWWSGKSDIQKDRKSKLGKAIQAFCLAIYVDKEVPRQMPILRTQREPSPLDTHAIALVVASKARRIQATIPAKK